MKKILTVLLPAFLLMSCGGSEDKLENTVKQGDSLSGPLKPIDVSEETINGIIQSIPTPIEIASLLKSNGATYDAAILNNTENSSKYNTNYNKSLNIGIYSADLGYINIYEKTFSAINYLSTVKGLADDIKVGQFFDFETLKRFASNNSNYDSLLYVSTDNFNKMDGFLREQKRGELSVLMISGAWLEGLYIATQVNTQIKNPELKERIGFEKINLDNILVILNAYKQDKYFANIVAEFDKLKAIYDTIKITYEYKAPETKEVNGQLVIVNNSKSTVSISDEQLKTITDALAQVRTALVK
jgi:uncharacterized protein YcfL